jgi:hypothetical protein
MVGWVVALVLFAHGIGHSLGILQATGIATTNAAWHGDSWLLSGPIGDGAARTVGVVLWSIALVGFCALAAALVGWLPASSFQPLAVASAAASLIAVAVFPVALPTFSTIGAVVVDVVVLAAVLLWDWTPAGVLR